MSPYIGVQPALVTSQAEKDTLDSYALLTVFYNNFTTLLRNLYDSAWRP
jgi:hypothetical protein